MQAIVIPELRWTVALALTGLLSVPSLVAQQVERYALSDDEVAIYNLAGQVRLEVGSGGAVSVQVTRGGADAAKVKVAQGKRDGVETLRFIYPGDRILYGPMSNGSSTQLRVRDDGTFGGDQDHDGKRNRDEGRRVTIASGGGGLDARANLRIGVPPGKQVSLYLAVGEIS